MKTTNRTTRARLPIQLAALAAGLFAWAAASAGGDGPCASPRDPGFIVDNGGYESIYGGGRGGRGPRGNSIVAENGGYESIFGGGTGDGRADRPASIVVDNGGYESIYGQSGRPCR